MKTRNGKKTVLEDIMEEDEEENESEEDILER
jgi:hypothetical protein